jgi:hypothetical protein
MIRLRTPLLRTKAQGLSFRQKAVRGRFVGAFVICRARMKGKLLREFSRKTIVAWGEGEK